MSAKLAYGATGGVSLLKATVCGNIWLIGCCIEAGEGYALNLQGTICEGGLVVRASRSVEGDSDQKCYLNGGIHGLGAAISDGLYIEGITLGLHPYEDKQASLNITVGFPKAQIGRGVSITHFYKSNTKPIRGICECPIIFDDACIDGNLCFYGLAINSGLYLRRTKIKGNLEMKCTLLPTELFEAIVRRGVDLTHACIEGDTFLYGVEIEGDFRATDASFGGNIILSCLATSEKENNYLPFSVHHVIFQRGVVRGTMALQGCNITGSLFLPYCHIDGSFELGGFQFSHGGEEILVNTSVGHDINLQSTKVRRSHTINGVNAKGCFYADFSSVGDNIVFDAIKTQDEYWNTIGGDLSYTGSDVAGTISIRYLKVDIDSRPQRRGISVTGAKIHKDVYLSDTDIRTQLSFIKTQIGGELRVTLPTEKDAFTSHGTPVIDLENIHVGKDLVLKASAELIKFKAANVKGNVRLQGEVKGSVQGRESRVGGSLEFNDVMFKSTFHNDLNQEEHALDWSDAEVGGVLSVKNRDYAAANKDFVVKSWRKPLSCYPDFDYVETLLNRPDGSWIASFLVPKLFWEAPGQHAVLLCNAYSAMFHTLNAAGKLDIDSEAKAREYVKLFCACVWGDDGAFAIIESVDVLPKDYVASIWGHSFDWQQVGPMKRLDLDSVLPNTDQKRIVGAQDIYLFKAYMWYGDALFEAYMLVKRGGLVEMLTHVNLLTFKRTFGAGNTSAIAGVP